MTQLPLSNPSTSAPWLLPQSKLPSAVPPISHKQRPGICFFLFFLTSITHSVAGLDGGYAFTWPKYGRFSTEPVRSLVTLYALVTLYT